MCGHCCQQIRCAHTVVSRSDVRTLSDIWTLLSADQNTVVSRSRSADNIRLICEHKVAAELNILSKERSRTNLGEDEGRNRRRL
ncbi:hypothetical protein QVD17_38248 [Tagetes erecta]|uniref:Uncharacterized protein n=1 Tax=Tagetes erecta TaxID=13708 RepID=A0AAD8JXD6_TARER|nr:hypothetical protein QVD17_38248 [Tagetes erecta]